MAVFGARDHAQEENFNTGHFGIDVYVRVHGAGLHMCVCVCVPLAGQHEGGSTISHDAFEHNESTHE